ncbi:MAG: hypothetical protein ABR529_09260 [Actinomycetota bacterium]
METGVSQLLIITGAILALAVETSPPGINLATAGLILMIVGGVGLLLSLLDRVGLVRALLDRLSNSLEEGEDERRSRRRNV